MNLLLISLMFKLQKQGKILCQQIQNILLNSFENMKPSALEITQNKPYEQFCLFLFHLCQKFVDAKVGCSFISQLEPTIIDVRCQYTNKLDYQFQISTSDFEFICDEFNSVLNALIKRLTELNAFQDEKIDAQSSTSHKAQEQENLESKEEIREVEQHQEDQLEEQQQEKEEKDKEDEQRQEEQQENSKQDEKQIEIQQYEEELENQQVKQGVEENKQEEVEQQSEKQANLDVVDAIIKKELTGYLNHLHDKMRFFSICTFLGGYNNKLQKFMLDNNTFEGIIQLVSLLQRINSISHIKNKALILQEKRCLRYFSSESYQDIFSTSMRLLSNLVHINREAQDYILNKDHLVTCLSNTNMDATNPLQREWSVMLIRNLCDSNDQMQEAISKLKIQDFSGKTQEILNKYQGKKQELEEIRIALEKGRAARKDQI